ncbi:MAG: FABP family protein [Actinomycetota bacterium]
MTEALRPLEFLLGTWAGGGEGDWPTVGRFTYLEEMRFASGGGGEDFPFLEYTQRAWDPETGVTMHQERGFWRYGGDRVDVTLAHPIGVTEIGEGEVSDHSIRLVSTRVMQATTGLPVTGLLRSYRLEGEDLLYEISLSTGEVPLTRHLTGKLARSGD